MSKKFELLNRFSQHHSSGYHWTMITSSRKDQIVNMDWISAPKLYWQQTSSFNHTAPCVFWSTMCFVMTVFTVNVSGCDCYRTILEHCCHAYTTSSKSPVLKELPIFILGLTSSAPLQCVTSYGVAVWFCAQWLHDNIRQSRHRKSQRFNGGEILPKTRNMQSVQILADSLPILDQENNRWGQNKDRLYIIYHKQV